VGDFSVLFTVLKSVAPASVPAAVCCICVYVLLTLLRRNDDLERTNREFDTAAAKEKTEVDGVLTERGRAYEIAYRYADADGRNLAQIVVPVVVAFNEGKTSDVMTFLVYVRNYLCVQRDDGHWVIKDHPNFLKMAREEIEAVDGDGK